MLCGVLQHACQSTGCKSPVELDDDLQHFGSRRLLLKIGESVVRWRNSLSSRAFSMAITAWSAKFRYQRNLFVGEGTYLLPVHARTSRSVVFPQHRDSSNRPSTAKFTPRVPDRV